MISVIVFYYFNPLILKAWFEHFKRYAQTNTFTFSSLQFHFSGWFPQLVIWLCPHNVFVKQFGQPDHCVRGCWHVCEGNNKSSLIGAKFPMKKKSPCSCSLQINKYSCQHNELHFKTSAHVQEPIHPSVLRNALTGMRAPSTVGFHPSPQSCNYLVN